MTNASLVRDWGATVWDAGSIPYTDRYTRQAAPTSTLADYARKVLYAQEVLRSQGTTLAKSTMLAKVLIRIQTYN
jgi:hypothetical protein